MQKLLLLFLAFFQIGSFSFGGGYAMLPYIEKIIIENNGWLTNSEFLDILAISQITPGPIAINAATFIGYRLIGFYGSVFATLGVVFGPFLFMSIVSKFIEKYKSSKLIEIIFQVLRPITASLILAACYSTFLKSVFDFYSFFVFSTSFLLLFFTKINPIFVIIIYGIIGILIKI